MWAVIAYVSFQVFEITFETFKAYKTVEKKVEFVTYWIGMVHGAISTYLAYFAIFYTW
jgi:hypothetical protein